MAEHSINFVINRLLKPLGIKLTAKVMIDASQGESTSLDAIKCAVFTFISTILYENKQEAQKWAERKDLQNLTEVLRLIGFDPFLFDLDNNSQDLLLILGWLIWRFDLFDTIYKPLLPSDPSLLPPYTKILRDPREVSPEPPISPPMDPQLLCIRIERLVSHISSGIQELVDLEMSRETLFSQVRAIDPETSLYSLGLKANPEYLKSHNEALREAIASHPRVEEVFRIEEEFWDWMGPIANRPQLNPGKFDELRSLPVDWFPPPTSSMYSRHNQSIDELQASMASLKARIEECESEITDAKAFDIIKEEVDTRMDPLERLEAIKESEILRNGEKLIPEYPFKEYSDAELMRVANRSVERGELIASTKGREIKEAVKTLSDSIGAEMHGWHCDDYKPRTETDDYDEEYKAPVAKKRTLVPPKQASKNTTKLKQRKSSLSHMQKPPFK